MRVKNPYVDMIQMMQKHGAKNNPFSVQLAKVVANSPISIQVGELPVGQDNLLVADYLLKNYKRQVTINEGIPVDLVTEDTFKEINHGILKINTKIDLVTEDIFKVDDVLAVVQLNSETFIILAKVVSL